MSALEFLILNILKYMEVYRPQEVFSFNFPSNAVRIMSGDRFLSRVMTIFIKTYFYKLSRTQACGGGGGGGGGGVFTMVNIGSPIYNIFALL